MKKFNQFVNEVYDIESGQAMAAHEKSAHSPSGSGVENARVRNEINSKLSKILDDHNRSLPNNCILSPEAGFERISKILNSHGISLPAILNLDGEEGEEVFEINQFGTPYGPLPSGQSGEVRSNFYLYVYYFLNESGYYEFFAQIVDEEELQDYMNITGEEDEA